MAKITDYQEEELKRLPLHVLANLEVETPADEKFIQAIVNLRRQELPVEDVYRRDFIGQMVDTPALEAERQKVIDERTEARRSKPIEVEEVPAGSAPTAMAVTTEEVKKVKKTFKKK